MLELVVLYGVWSVDVQIQTLWKPRHSYTMTCESKIGDFIGTFTYVI
jgi:hypothetical protein